MNNTRQETSPKNYFKRAERLYESIKRNNRILEGTMPMSYDLYVSYTKRVNNLANKAIENMPEDEYAVLKSKLNECIGMIFKARLKSRKSLKGLEMTVEEELSEEVHDEEYRAETEEIMRDIFLGNPITYETIQKTL